MIKPDFDALQTSKNLLAFSAGVDSSALFFLLIDAGISFDIVLVNYGLREEASEEEAYAKALAQRYQCQCYSIQAPLFETNFEKNARDFRYAFFEKLIDKYHYDTLLTAHHIGDQLEWFLMRLTKGAGVSELLGLQRLTPKNGYTMIRPLLSQTKEELLTYLHLHHHPYFVDKSNTDPKYERNRFRKDFSDPLMAHYSEGIRRSFDYLRTDKERLESQFETVFETQKLHIIKLHSPLGKVKATDLTLKKLGYLLSASQREAIDKEKSLVIGGVWAIEVQEDLVYICPYLLSPMPKKFKERCRVLKIPPKIRAYCFEAKIEIESL